MGIVCPIRSAREQRQGPDCYHEITRSNVARPAKGIAATVSLDVSESPEQLDLLRCGKLRLV